MYRTKVDNNDKEFWVQVGFSVAFLLAGFSVLLLGFGQASTATLAAGWVGAVLGFWLA
jgi:hypothetical protein